MPKYRHVGDQPLSLPSHGLENIPPGAIVDVAEAINHPHFELIKDKPKAVDKEKK